MNQLDLSVDQISEINKVFHNGFQSFKLISWDKQGHIFYLVRKSPSQLSTCSFSDKPYTVLRLNDIHGTLGELIYFSF